MKNYNIEILPLAQADISQALDYIAIDLCNPSAALKLHKIINDNFKRLQVTPFCGQQLITDFPMIYNFRWVLAENYMIFYTINEELNTVFVMRMLFGSTDYITKLNDE